MKIYIARHYWKDGKNATWEYNKKIDDNIFEYLKKDYHNFVQNRPLLIKKDNFYIYLCYEDSIDIYERNITNITFFVSSKKHSINCKKVRYKNLELEIADNNLFSITNTVVVIMLLSVMAIYFLQNDTDVVIDEKKSIKASNKELSKTKPIIKEKIKVTAQLKEKEIKIKYNNEIKNEIKQLPLINTSDDLDKFTKNVLTLQKKSLNPNLSNENKKAIKEKQNLANEYKRAIKSMKIDLKLIKSKRDTKAIIKEILLDHKKCKKKNKSLWWECTLKKGDIHIVLETKGFLNKNIIIVDKNKIIDKNDKIKIFNAHKFVKFEIKDGYYVEIKKLPDTKVKKREKQ